MNYRLFLMAITAALILVSCDKNNDLNPTTEPIDSSEKLLPTANEETITSTQFELKEPAYNVKAFTAPGAVKLYDQFITVQAGKWHSIYYNKNLVNSKYRYVCKLVPISGDPDLYILIKNAQGKYTFIRNSRKSGLAQEQSYGEQQDFVRTPGNRLYFSAYCYKKSTFKMELWREPLQQANCTIEDEKFESYQVGRSIDSQSQDWYTISRKNPAKIFPLITGSQTLKMYTGEAAHHKVELKEGNKYEFIAKMSVAPKTVAYITFHDKAIQEWESIPELMIELDNGQRTIRLIQKGKKIKVFDVPKDYKFLDKFFAVVFDFKANTIAFTYGPLRFYYTIDNFNARQIKTIGFTPASYTGQNMQVNSLSIKQQGC